MKKLFTLLTLLLCAVMVNAEEEYYVKFLKSSDIKQTKEGFFTWNKGEGTAVSWSSKGKHTCKYDGETYSDVIKMEAATQVLFKSSVKATVTIVQTTSNNDADLLKFDGGNLDADLANTDVTVDATNTCRIYVITDVEAGEHKITRQKETGLAYVKVTYTEENTEPELDVTPKTLTLDLIPVALSKEATFTVTGKNLTDGTYSLDVPAVTGLEVSPASFTVSGGEVNQEFTVSYASEVDVTADAAAISATVGEKTIEVKVNYSARATAYTQTAVSDATTWDWEKLTATVELSDATTPTNKDWFLFANIEGLNGLAFNDDFTLAQAQQLKLKAQFPSRSKKFQNGTIQFIADVPGSIKVDFSDTGTTASDGDARRYIIVNGLQTEYWTRRDGTSDRKTTEAISVPAGEVTISSSSAIVVYKLTFTPDGAPSTVSAEITDAGYATFVSQYEVVIPEGVTAYTATAAEAGKVTLTPIEGDNIPAATPVVLKGAADSYVLTVTTNDATVEGKNLLKGVIGDTTPADADYYTLAVVEGVPVFKKSAGGTLAAGKAYLVVPAAKSEARTLTVSFGDATAISNVQTVKADAALYNLSGARVAQAQKGVYIQNGKKVVVK